MSQKAKLRVCGRCEWIFSGNTGCPMCGFATYSAHSVYGRKAYRYKLNQDPWIRNKLAIYAGELHAIIQGKQSELLIDAVFDLVKEAAPLTWASLGDADSAHAWEIKMQELLTRYKIREW